MTTVVSNIGAATPDWRYARGVSSGALAELVGLGPRGIRWGQVMVIMAGTWLAGNAAAIQRLSALDTHGPIELLLVFAFPLLFAFSAITAVRSFQNGLAVTLSAAVIYAALNTSLRFATVPSPGAFDSGDYWLRAGAASFTWMAFTMFALQFAVAGHNRWLRMVWALLAASLAQTVVTAALYVDISDPGRVLTLLLSTAVTGAVNALVWTLAFWIGLTKFARQ